MIINLGRVVLIQVLIVGLCIPSFAQRYPAQSTKSSGPRKQLATIVFSGLAGAVLGLSTLSFYARPQDKLSNIAVGFAIGIISGTVYTTYKTATRPYGFNEIERDLLFADLDKVFSPLSTQTFRLSQTWDF